MPVKYQGRTPPKDCPICGEMLRWLDVAGTSERWVRTNTYVNRWDAYDIHIRENHPEFGRWDRRMSFYYAFPFLLLLGPGPLVLGYSPLPYAVQLAILLSWASAPAIAVIVWLFKRRGASRFQELWNEQHGAAMKSP